MELVYFVGSCLWIPVALKFGDWKSLKRYAASVYYVMLGSVLAVVITANRELWIYESPTYHIDDTIIELFITFVVFPSAFFVFLSRYPNGSGVLKPFYISRCGSAFLQAAKPLFTIIFGSCRIIMAGLYLLCIREIE